MLAMKPMQCRRACLPSFEQQVLKEHEVGTDSRNARLTGDQRFTENFSLMRPDDRRLSFSNEGENEGIPFEALFNDEATPASTDDDHIPSFLKTLISICGLEYRTNRDIHGSVWVIIGIQGEYVVSQ